MTNPGNISPFIGLIDDDGHSAYLFMRIMAGLRGPAVRNYGDGEVGAANLGLVLSDAAAEWPELLVVDLKAHSDATLEFVRRHQAWLRQKGVPVVVMVRPIGRVECDAYYEAGAAAVFFRQPEVDAYRRELAGIENFWARSQRQDAVGM